VGISSVKQRTVDVNLHFSDTFQIAIGQQLRIGEKWFWSAGFAYDSSPVSRVNRTPTMCLSIASCATEPASNIRSIAT
jgi:long-subunit fatty acid transport protein